MSTSTMIAWTPLAVLPRSGPKYAVLSRPGSVPGRTAPRRGFALPESSPSPEHAAGLGRPADANAPARELELVGRDAQHTRCEVENLPAHRHRGRVTRT